MTVPPVPGARFTVIEAQFFLGTLEAFLDGPAQPSGAGQLSQSSAARSEGEVIGTLLRIAPITPDQPPAFEVAVHHPGQRDACPIVEA